jgi:hypothetical protein
LPEAELFFRRSLAIRQKNLGPDHPSVAESLNNLVGLLLVKEQYDKAFFALKRSLSIESIWLIRELPLLPDQLRAAQLRKLSYPWKYSFGLIGRHPGAGQLALETRLNRQGLLPEIEQRQALLLGTTSVDPTKFEQLQALNQQLSSISLSPNRRGSVREQRDKLQAEIYRQLPELQIQLVTLAEVARALPANGVLVEFQRYRPYDGRNRKDQRWGQLQYIALVLKPNGSITTVPLGPAAKIDDQVLKALTAAAENYQVPEGAWTQLSNLVIKPLLPQLIGSRQWFISPDSELNRVPFAALPSPLNPGESIGSEVQLRLLTTGRELIRLKQEPVAGQSPVVFANPNYDRPQLTASYSTSPTGIQEQQRSSAIGSERWNRLPRTEQEGQQVAKLLVTNPITGDQATTTRLQSIKGPRVLHVATHGFFAADQVNQPNDPLRSLQETGRQIQGFRGEDPLLRSGLVLAGANQPEADPNDDGYLTASEAAKLQLEGTELVVLSACATGHGDIRSGEGVYGLQRALTVAGARSTLLSLWKVDDAATAEFMTRFYKRLKAGEGRSDALAATQKEFRDGQVRDPQTKLVWNSPYYWAAWQLVGDWRPIKGL